MLDWYFVDHPSAFDTAYTMKVDAIYERLDHRT